MQLSPVNRSKLPLAMQLWLLSLAFGGVWCWKRVQGEGTCFVFGWHLVSGWAGQLGIYKSLEAFRIGFDRRCLRVWSWSLDIVVMFRRWEVWLKLACSILAFSRCALIASLDAVDTGPSHLHCMSAWDFWYGVGVIEGTLPFVWGIKESIG